MERAPSIDFCIPAIGAGARYLDYLVANLLRTAARPERIRILVSHHTDEDRAAIKATPAAARIAGYVKVPAHQNVMFAPSANHSSAINALAAACTADIIILSDYDMAFLMPGWDVAIAGRVHGGGLDLFGVPYPPLLLTQQFPKDGALAWLTGVSLAKYQRMPNLSFLALRRELLGACFPGGRITSFDSYLAEGNLPFRVMNTRAIAIENQIPMGMVQWLDTGYELPEIIARHGLRHEALAYRGVADQDAFTAIEPFARLDGIRQPEFFYLGPEPCLCHFKKGSMKAQNGTPVSLFDLFVANVEGFLATRAAAAQAREAIPA
ncbi:MAG: hypothetical protein ACKOUS_05585 [Alphaproteobacteria bacterium]